MQHKFNDLPMHMYHRIYRFARRGVDVDRIAATLHLPIRTVQRVLERFAHAKSHADVENLGVFAEAERSVDIDTGTFLDIYIVPKVRYVVADLSGSIIADHCDKLNAELDNLAKSQWKVIALLMRDVLAIDVPGSEAILTFHNGLAERGRYVAILDPSPRLETFIAKHELDTKIPVFGTEKTFEDEAFLPGGRRSVLKRPH
jgi:hypothetical protein